MGQGALDVVGVGNAIVDILAHVDEAFLVKHDLVKGTMKLIDADEAERMYMASPPAIEASGGSVANTMVGIASLGGASAYIGKVRDDQLGDVFAHDMRAIGVEFKGEHAAAGPPTARSLVFVTPDAQRTMSTYLGACADLGPDDIAADVITRAKITYLEGYLWDRPEGQAALRKAATLAREAGRKVAFSLSDPFCVERHRCEFRALVESEVDILFANEREIMSLYEVPHFDDALQRIQGQCEVAALTRSENGSVIVAGDRVHVIDASRPGEVVDTTGAGDLYAAGVLFGLSCGHDLATCARLGAIAAAEVISHFGARPEASLATLIRQELD